MRSNSDLGSIFAVASASRRLLMHSPASGRRRFDATAELDRVRRISKLECLNSSEKEEQDEGGEGKEEGAEGNEGGAEAEAANCAEGHGGRNFRRPTDRPTDRPIGI
eukprot:COSAG05_NODE_300_length_11883_cov_12.913357_13_plen_107_part_00